MKATILNNSKNFLMGCAVSVSLAACQSASKEGFTLEQQGDTLTFVHITNPAKYLLLPVEEHTGEGQVCLVTGNPADTDMDIRLAKKETDYFVPFELPAGSKRGGLSVSAKRRRMPYAGKR